MSTSAPANKLTIGRTGVQCTQQFKRRNSSNNIAYKNTKNFLYRASWGGMVDDIETFSPTLVGDLRIGLTRYDPYYGQASAGYDPTKLGFPSYIAANSTHLMMPMFTISDGYTGTPAVITATSPPTSISSLTVTPR